MPKLFKTQGTITDEINKLVNTGNVALNRVMENMVDLGSRAYKAALVAAYDRALQEYASGINRIVSSTKARTYRDLTLAYRRDKSVREAGSSKQPKLNKSGTSRTVYPNHHFLGYRALQEQFTTRKKRRISGVPLFRFIKQMARRPETISDLRRYFGGLEEEVFGSVFKKGTSATQSYLKNKSGKRVKTVDQVIQSKIHLQEGVVRTSAGRFTDPSSGRSFGYRKASEKGLIGSKISYSAANRLRRVINQNNKDTIKVFKTAGGQYGGIFRNTGGQLQAYKLSDMASGNKRGDNSFRSPIDPFREEAIRMLGLDGTQGYLAQYTSLELKKLYDKIQSVKAKTPYGEASIRTPR